MQTELKWIPKSLYYIWMLEWRKTRADLIQQQQRQRLTLTHSPADLHTGIDGVRRKDATPWLCRYSHPHLESRINLKCWNVSSRVFPTAVVCLCSSDSLHHQSFQFLGSRSLFPDAIENNVVYCQSGDRRWWMNAQRGVWKKKLHAHNFKKVVEWKSGKNKTFK